MSQTGEAPPGDMAESLPIQLEVGTDSSSNADSDGAPAYLEDSSTSVKSSVYNYLVENGRSYHAYKSGKYFLPNDAPEQARLDLQHHSFMIMLDGRLSLCPFPSPPRYVLDMGTGTGIWAIEFARAFPSSLVIGSDLSPIQPAYVPSNCRFEIGDAEEDDWGFLDMRFDYVHMRAMVTCFKDARPVIARVRENLAQGGWFELQDPCLPMRCDDGSWDGSAIKRWNALLDEGMRRIGKDLKDNVNWGRYMREEGFEEVSEHHSVVAFNTWPKGEKNKLLGAISLQNMLEGVDSMSRALFTRVLGWTVEEVDELLRSVKEDLQNKRIHVFCAVYFVYGRRPADGTG